MTQSQKYLAAHPAEPFNEFLYYTIGDYDKALAVNPHTVIESVIRYAIGFRMFGSLLADVAKAVHVKVEGAIPMQSTTPSVSLIVNPMSMATSCWVRACRISRRVRLPRNPGSKQCCAERRLPCKMMPAYDLAGLQFQQGKFSDAFVYLGQAMTAGNRDYSGAAVRETIRVLSRFSPQRTGRHRRRQIQLSRSSRRCGMSPRARPTGSVRFRAGDCDRKAGGVPQAVKVSPQLAAGDDRS